MVIHREKNNNLTANDTPFRFGVDADGKYGYILPDGEGGADTVHPFSSFSIENMEKILEKSLSSSSASPSFTVNCEAGTYIAEIITVGYLGTAGVSKLTGCEYTRLSYWSRNDDNYVYQTSGYCTFVGIFIVKTSGNFTINPSLYGRSMTGRCTLFN